MREVTIIGGGLAGLACAEVLLDEDSAMNVTIIEARDRAGGRTHTTSIRIPRALSVTSDLATDSLDRSAVSSGDDVCGSSGGIDEPVDIGGQWIGALHLKLLGLIRRFNLELIDQEFTCSQLSNSGRLVEITGISMSSLSEPELEELVRFSRKLEELSINLRSKELSVKLTGEDIARLDSVSVVEYVNENLNYESVRNEILLFVQTILACDPNECSMLFLVHYIGSSGGMESLGDGELGAQKWKLKGGSMQVSTMLLESIMERYGERFKYITNTNISAIEKRSADKAAAAAADSFKSYQYYLYDNNHTLCAVSDKVVIAMAPSLAVKTINFQPPTLISEGRRQLYESYRMGSAIKVIIFYKDSFWSASEQAGRCLSVTSLLSHFDIHNIFITKSGSGLPGIVLLITGAKARALSALHSRDENSFKELIFLQLSQLYSVDLSVASNCLSFTSKDWCADSLSAGCFVGVFPPCAMTDWFRYSNQLASDSNQSQCSEQSISTSSISDSDKDAPFDFADLFSSNDLPKGVAPQVGFSVHDIYWASSETSDRFCGYMEGALLAGEDQARRILLNESTKKNILHEDE